MTAKEIKEKLKYHENQFLCYPNWIDWHYANDYKKMLEKE
jgi:hypothetical protein